jgi:hypothetical protein
MSVATQMPTNRYLDRPAPSSLADVIETILDKGLVIDIYVRVSLVGIELLTIDARIVIASVDTYLRFAEAVNRLDLTENSQGLPELLEGMTQSGAKSKTSGAIEGAKDKFEEMFGGDDDDSKDDSEDDDSDDKAKSQPAKPRRRRPPSRR